MPEPAPEHADEPQHSMQFWASHEKLNVLKLRVLYPNVTKKPAETTDIARTVKAAITAASGNATNFALRTLRRGMKGLA
jgi:hypothetical protein